MPALRRLWPLALALGLVLAIGGLLWQRATLAEPHPSVLVTDRHGQFLAQLGDPAAGYGYWPVERIPPRVAQAMLALEDRHFWLHPGVDPLAVLRAALANARAGHRVSGASTIAMQVARMTRPAPRTYVAKALEAATALALTARYGRARLFQEYLRLVPFGQNSHGIAHAARWYFDKPVEDLSWAEIAFLSAIPQSPGLDNPGTLTGRRRIQARGRTALARLRADGILGEAEHDQALADLDGLVPQIHPTRDPAALHAILEIGALAGRTGPVEHIRSTIDLALQRRVEELARDRLDSLRAQGAQQLAVMLVDRASLEVLALIGSGRWAAAEAGEIDYAFRTRSPGSTLKPFIFAQALETGDIAPTTVLMDAPDNGTSIDNADRRFLGPLLPRQALGNSRNVPAAALVRRSGLARTWWFLASLGLHDETRPAERYGLTLSVGGLPTDLDRLVTAYGALANGGELAPLRWYAEQPLPAARPVLSARTAAILTDFLADPMARLPSFARMGAIEFPFPVAIKTGTSQGYRDAWVVAYSERYLIGVWVGRPDGRPMNGLSGAGSAALIGRDILLALHGQDADGLSDGRFRPPAGLEARPVCTLSGRAAEDCPQQLAEYVTAPGPPAADPPPGPPPRLRIASPLNHAILLRNPETPAALAVLPLRLTASSSPLQVVWSVDGRDFAVAGPGETVRWPLTPGHHVIAARAAYGAAAAPPVAVTVR